MRFGSTESFFVCYHAKINQFFIHQDGQTWPASRRRVASRFGEVFTQVLQLQTPNMWIEFDDDVRADMAAIEKARARFQAVGITQSAEWEHPMFAVYDSETDVIFPIHFAEYESALLYIDDMSQPACDAKIGEGKYIHPSVKLPADAALERLAPSRQRFDGNYALAESVAAVLH